MAARYFKVIYDFSTNEARNMCNTSFSCDFDWAIHFLYYFYDSRSSSRSKSQFQGQISKKIPFLTNKVWSMCNTYFSWDFVWKIYLWYYFVDPRSSSRSKGDFQGQKMTARYFKVKYDFSTNEARDKCNTSFSCNFDWAIHLLYYFDDSRSSSRWKVNFKVK